jgi:hypothetical protein
MDPTDPTPIPPAAQKALQNEQEGTATTTSPTGTPKVAPKAVPWLLALIVGLGAGLGVCAAKATDPNVRLACEVGATVVSGVIGTLSPGLRRNDGSAQ